MSPSTTAEKRTEIVVPLVRGGVIWGSGKRKIGVGGDAGRSKATYGGVGKVNPTRVALSGARDPGPGIAICKLFFTIVLRHYHGACIWKAVIGCEVGRYSCRPMGGACKGDCESARYSCGKIRTGC